jgi:hypothetical protein
MSVVQMDYGGLPSRALVKAVRIMIGGMPRLVEPSEVRFVVGDSFLDRLEGFSIGCMV